MFKKLMCIFILLLTTDKFFAQQDPMFTHYMYNTLWLNPAYAGTREALTFTGIHRSQWVAFDGAPLDQSLTIHSPVLMNKGGCGLSVINDRIGPSKSTWVALDFAYHLKLNSKSKISFGLKGLANFYRNNVSNLKLDQQADVSFAQNVSSVLPNVGVGAYYYRKKLYAGLSSPRLIENKLESGASAFAKEKRHYFFISGFVIDLNKNTALKPTTFVKVTPGAPIEGEITMIFVFNDKFFLGSGYRTGDAAYALTGFNITEQLNIGYSFDWSFANTTGKYNNGSHEIMIRYDLVFKNDKKIKSPRYF